MAQRRQTQERRKGGAPQLVERDNALWEAYVAGGSVAQLAVQFEMSGAGVKRRLDFLRRKYGELEANDAVSMRQRLIMSALDVMKNLSELMHSDPIPAYSNGKPVVDADGEIAWDYSTRINAAKALLLANRRLSELTGADAPAQVEITVTEQAQQSAQEAAEAALRRVLGQDAPALPATPATDDDEIIVEAFVQEAQALLDNVTAGRAPTTDPAFAPDDPL